MKSFFFGRRCAVISGLFFVNLLVFAGNTLIAQTAPVLELEGIVDPEKKINLVITPNAGFLRKRIDRSLIPRYRNAEGFHPYTILYDYEERKLVPGEETPCSLSLYVISNDAMNQPGRTIETWYGKYSVKVEGEFMDDRFKIPVKFSESEQAPGAPSLSGTIELVAHQRSPKYALEIISAARTPIVIRAAEDQKIDVAIKNNSGCRIHISGVEILPTDGSLWNPKALKFQIIEPEIPIGEKGESTAVKLDLKPHWTTFLRKGLMPPNIQRPSRIELVINYQVENGKAANTRKYFEVSFTPPILMLLITPIIAAAATFFLIFFIIWTPRKRHAALRKPCKIEDLLRRAAFGMGVAFISFTALWAFRDDIEFRLFNFSINPDQLFTPVLIGIVAGAKPKYLLEKMRDLTGGKPGSGPRPGKKSSPIHKIVHPLLLFVFLSSLFCPSAARAAQTGAPFRPIMLAYHEKSNSIYTVDWGGGGNVGTIYRIDANAAAPKLEIVKRMRVVGEPTDHCLVERGAELWLATVSIETNEGIQQSRVFLIPLFGQEKPSEIIVPKEKMIKRGVGQCWAVTYDRIQNRLLLTDAVRRAVYEVRIEENSLGKSGPVIKDPAFIRPTAILSHDHLLFVADPGTGSVTQFTLPGNVKRTVATGLVNPLSLSISPGGGSIFIADSGRGIIVEAPLTAGRTQSDRISNPELQGPNGVIVDRSGKIWVADMNAMAIFKFSATAELQLTLRPAAGHGHM